MCHCCSFPKKDLSLVPDFPLITVVLDILFLIVPLVEVILSLLLRVCLWMLFHCVLIQITLKGRELSQLALMPLDAEDLLIPFLQKDVYVIDVLFF